MVLSLTYVGTADCRHCWLSPSLFTKRQEAMGEIGVETVEKTHWLWRLCWSCWSLLIVSRKTLDEHDVERVMNLRDGIESLVALTWQLFSNNRITQISKSQWITDFFSLVHLNFSTRESLISFFKLTLFSVSSFRLGSFKFRPLCFHKNLLFLTCFFRSFFFFEITFS